MVKYIYLIIISLYLSKTSVDFTPYFSNYRKVLLNQALVKPQKLI